MQLRVSDGKVLLTIPAGKSPGEMAIDGLNLWVANIDDGTVTKLRAGDGKVLSTFAVGGGPGPLAFDGVNMWVVNNGPGTVTKLRASDGANLGTFNTGGSLPAAIAFDRAYLDRKLWNFTGQREPDQAAAE
jgi:DNA-binding beta-propeller fold protein YncE